MLFGSIQEGGRVTPGPALKREDSFGYLDSSSSSSESNDSFINYRRGSQISDIFPYLDEDAQDAVFYQEEDESTFVSVPLLAQKLEKEVNNLFNNPQQQLRQDGSVAASSSPSTILVGLMETMNKVASQLLDLSETEPYGVKGARVILKLRSNNGKEQNVGSFTLDQCTVSTFQITLVLEQTQQFSTSLRSWLGQITNGSKCLHISPHYSLKKVDLYSSAQKSVTFRI